MNLNQATPTNVASNMFLGADWKWIGFKKRILTFDSQVYGDRYADFCIIYLNIHIYTVYTLSNLLFHPCAFVHLKCNTYNVK